MCVCVCVSLCVCVVWWLLQSLIVDVSPIFRVNLVRRNVDATIRLLDKFRSLPEQCDALLDDMYEHDRHIKRVYRGLRQLMLLRDTAFDPTISASFSDDFTSELTDTFMHLTDAADEVELRIWENIGDSFFLAKNDPTVIIRTLEVIEMEDRAKRKVFGGSGSGSNSAPTAATSAAQQQAAGGGGGGGGGGKKKSAMLAPIGGPRAQASTAGDGAGGGTAGGGHRMRERCLLTLEKSIADAFADLHKDEAEAKRQKRIKAKQKAKEEEKQKKRELKEEKGGEGNDDVDDDDEVADDDGALGDGDEVEVLSDAVSDYAIEVLEQMQDLVEQLDDITQTLGPCFPPTYSIISFYELRYRHWIKGQHTSASSPSPSHAHTHHHG